MTRHFSRDIALVTALGALVRGMLLARQPLWRDEAFTALTVQHPMQSTLDIVSRDSAPPLAYILEHAVVSVIGSSPAGLRSVSLVAGIATIPVAAVLGRRLAGDAAGIWTAVACALLPALTISSRDVRMYALATLLVTATALALWRLCEAPSPRRWLLYALVAAAALLTDYMAAPAIITLSLGAWWGLRPSRRALLAIAAADAVAGALLVPWLLLASAQFQHAGAPFWVKPLGPLTIGGTVFQFFGGPPIDPGTPFQSALQAVQVLALCAGVVALAGLATRGQSFDARVRGGVIFIAIGGTGTGAVLAVLSLWHPLLEARYTSVGWGLLAVLVGTGVASWAGRAIRGAIAAALCVSAVTLGIAMTHPDTPAAVAYLDSHPAAFVAASPSSYLLLRYYGNTGIQERTHVVATDVPWYWGTAAYPPGAVVSVVPAPDVASRKPIASVYGNGESPISPPEGYRVSATWCTRGMCITTFTAG